MKTNTLFKYIQYLAAAGILLAVYLLWQQLFQPAFKPCSSNANINCDAIISGGVAKTFGISTPLIGLIGYIVIFVSSILKQKRVVLAMAGFGLAFCLSIAYIELFQLKVICPVCIACQLIMTTIFILAYILVTNQRMEN